MTALARAVACYAAPTAIVVPVACESASPRDVRPQPSSPLNEARYKTATGGHLEPTAYLYDRDREIAVAGADLGSGLRWQRSALLTGSRNDGLVRHRGAPAELR